MAICAAIASFTWIDMLYLKISELKPIRIHPSRSKNAIKSLFKISRKKRPDATKMSSKLITKRT